MFKPYGDSKKFVDVRTGVKDKTYRCWLPPQPPDEEIKNSHLPHKDQIWRRTELPVYKVREIDIFYFDQPYQPDDDITFEEAARQEHIKQTGRDPSVITTRGEAKLVLPKAEIDPNYVSETLQQFREQEWEKIFGTDEKPWGGEWVYINGVAIWLTRFHYFYLNYWPLNTGYAEFRITDRNGFYLWQYTITCPYLHALNELTKRGQGKSYRAGSIAYLMSISFKKAHIGIQSKTEKDASDLFDDKIVEPYKDLPNFLIPENKNPSDPSKTLQWSPLGRSGTGANLNRKVLDALRSKLDYRSAKDGAYDGSTLKFLLHDEAGKIEPGEGNIQKRIGITKECIFRDGKLIGKMYLTTTIEDMGNGGDNFKKVFLQGMEYNDKGFPKNKILNYFLPASDCTFFDKYGYPVDRKPHKDKHKYLMEKYGEHALLGAKLYHKQNKADLEGDPTEWVGYCQRNPDSWEEAFMVQGKKCIYNAAILQKAQKRCQDPDFLAGVYGDLEWKDGKPDTEVIWVPNPNNGRWFASWLFLDQAKEANKVQLGETEDGIMVRPMNDMNFAIAFDPFKAATNQSGKKGRSNAGLAVYRKMNALDPDQSDTFVMDYVHRTSDPEESYEDLIKTMFFFGCKALVENQVADCTRHLRKRGYAAFVMKRPPETFPNGDPHQYIDMDGVPASDVVIQQYINRMKHHVYVHGHKLRHLRIIRDLLEFDPVNRTKYDLAVASQLCILAAENSYAVDDDLMRESQEVTELFPNLNWKS